jgi:hypothetical protein
MCSKPVLCTWIINGITNKKVPNTIKIIPILVCFNNFLYFTYSINSILFVIKQKRIVLKFLYHSTEPDINLPYIVT